LKVRDKAFAELWIGVFSAASGEHPVKSMSVINAARNGFIYLMEDPKKNGTPER